MKFFKKEEIKNSIKNTTKKTFTINALKELKTVALFFRNLFYVIIDIFLDSKKSFISLSKKEYKTNAGKNNFKAGLIMLKKRKFLDAKFRFWLCSKMIPDYGVVFYYYALSHFLSGNSKKATELLYKATKTKKYPQKKILQLIEAIESQSQNLASAANPLFKKFNQTK